LNSAEIKFRPIFPEEQQSNFQLEIWASKSTHKLTANVK